MTESFTVTRRFFDDKNYPRGFLRHGDYTIKEAQILEQYGQAFKALADGERKPLTKEEKDFVACCKGKREPETFFEKTWCKYHSRISTVRKIYTLSGEMGTDIEDFSVE